ncbi:MAG: Tol-Pal system protein TolB [Sulfurimonas sp.]
MRVLLFLLSLCVTTSLFAVDATLKIEKDVEHRSRIALVDGSDQQNQKLFKILLSDLKISGHFLPDNSVHTGEFTSDYIDPALKSQEYVLKYKFFQGSGAKLYIRLLRTSDGAQLFKKSYSIPRARKMPFLAHKVATDINAYLKYPDISWINRYVVYTRYSGAKRSEILLADYTFTYQKVIIRGGLNLFPKWADAKQRSFYYTSYSGLIPTLYRINIYTGQKSKIISSEGMLVCSDISEDFSKLLLTMAPEGHADIFELNLANRQKKRVTRFNGIDVNGKYTDDEKSIVFVSNRLGYANVFKKSIHSAAVAPVVYHGKNNNACDTYRGNVVYSSRESESSFGRNKFNLYLTSSSGGDTRPLTTTGTNQFPRFSSNGSVVLYIKHHERGSSIGYINLHSYQSLLFPIDGKKLQSIDW